MWVNVVLQRQRDQGCDNQHYDYDRRELLPKDLPEAFPRLLGQLIEAVLLQSTRHCRLTETAISVRVELL